MTATLHQSRPTSTYATRTLAYGPNTLQKKTHSRFSPEQQQLLCCRHLMVIYIDWRLAIRMVLNTRFEEDQGYGGYTAPRRLKRPEPPLVFSIEPTAIWFQPPHLHQSDAKYTHLIHSISIRCCSATLFSLFTFRCRAVKILRLSIKYCPHWNFKSTIGWLAIPFASVAAAPFFGGMAKYSSSSRRTMMACLEMSGFCDGGGPKSGEAGRSWRCCWAAKSPGELDVP